MNIVGASGFIINCTATHTWPSVALNVAWLGIAVYALRRNSQLKMSAAAGPGGQGS
jgi:hypothetical protein